MSSDLYPYGETMLRHTGWWEFAEIELYLMDGYTMHPEHEYLDDVMDYRVHGVATRLLAGKYVRWDTEDSLVRFCVHQSMYTWGESRTASSLALPGKRMDRVVRRAVRWVDRRTNFRLVAKEPVKEYRKLSATGLLSVERGSKRLILHHGFEARLSACGGDFTVTIGPEVVTMSFNVLRTRWTE